MSKFRTFPDLYDEMKTLRISYLNRNNYLKQGFKTSGIINWVSKGEVTSSISVSVTNLSINPFITLKYTSKSTPISYNVQLVSIPSNLGKGVIWYFICPATRKRCRKLYLCGGYFYHRSAFRGCMYEKQTYSHNTRWLGKQVDQLFGSDKAYEKIYSKHFKKTYNGRKTKRYKKLLEQIEISDKVDPKILMNY